MGVNGKSGLEGRSVEIINRTGYNCMERIEYISRTNYRIYGEERTRNEI